LIVEPGLVTVVIQHLNAKAAGSGVQYIYIIYIIYIYTTIYIIYIYTWYIYHVPDHKAINLKLTPEYTPVQKQALIRHG
jgi:hypothetical protein